MPEENDGGTPEPKTFTEEEVEAIRTEAKEVGQKESHSHFQSVFDKEVAKIRSDSGKENDSLNTSLREMRAANLAALPEDERTSAMVREMYDERNKPAPASPASDNSNVPGSPAGGASQEDFQTAINNSLKELGVDLEKINWGASNDGNANMKTFLASVLEQGKGDAKTADKSSDADKDDDGAKDKSESQKHIDTSRGAGDAADFIKRDPQDLVSQDEWKPIRGMMD